MEVWSSRVESAEEAPPGQSTNRTCVLIISWTDGCCYSFAISRSALGPLLVDLLVCPFRSQEALASRQFTVWHPQGTSNLIYAQAQESCLCPVKVSRRRRQSVNNWNLFVILIITLHLFGICKLKVVPSALINKSPPAPTSSKVLTLFAPVFHCHLSRVYLKDFF